MRLTKNQKDALLIDIMDDVPNIDVVAEKIAIQAALVKAMSPEVRKVYRTKPHALISTHVPELYDSISWASRTVVIGDVSDEVKAEILKPLLDKVSARRDVYFNLKSAIDACSTLKQLKATLPEFEKYFPTETAPIKNLPAVANLVTDLMKLGWPKGDASTA